jgi:hypothetical protein
MSFYVSSAQTMQVQTWQQNLPRRNRSNAEARRGKLVKAKSVDSEKENEGSPEGILEKKGTAAAPVRSNSAYRDSLHSGADTH